MPPTRTRSADANSHSEHGKQKNKFYKKPQYDEKTPGVQKIKSSIRQTKRLLAKDTLAADVRVETERRLQALEAELTQSEASRKERNMAVKYHKVKFFEKQKLVRKINQTKKKLAEESSDVLQSTLYDLRVDLNYVLHYPKSKRYISLFPPQVRESGQEEPAELPPNPERDAVRDWVRSKMKGGELPTEPEKHLDSRGGDLQTKRDDWGQKDSAKSAKATRKSDAKTKGPSKIEQDEFFAADEESVQEEDDGSGSDSGSDSE